MTHSILFYKQRPMSQPRGIPTNHRGGHNMHPSMGTSPQTQQMHYSPQTHPYMIAANMPNMPGTPMVSRVRLCNQEWSRNKCFMCGASKV